MKLWVIFFFVVSNIMCYTPIFKSNDYSYRYGSKQRKYYKKLMKYSGKVQDHHCIPRQFRNHKLLREIGYDVDAAVNLKIMPTKKGIINLNLDPNTMTHDMGHPLYNKFVGNQLTIILNEPTLDMKKYQFWLFLSFLKKNMQFNTANIPWV